MHRTLPTPFPHSSPPTHNIARLVNIYRTFISSPEIQQFAYCFLLLVLACPAILDKEIAQGAEVLLLRKTKTLLRMVLVILYPG
jgi:hypothetical protein